MGDLFLEFRRFIEALNKENVDYILIGGFACILHGMDRLTRDIDIFIRLDSFNIDKLKKALKNLYEDESIEEIRFEELKKYQVIRYGTPSDFFIFAHAEQKT